MDAGRGQGLIGSNPYQGKIQGPKCCCGSKGFGKPCGVDPGTKAGLGQGKFGGAGQIQNAPVGKSGAGQIQRARTEPECPGSSSGLG